MNSSTDIDSNHHSIPLPEIQQRSKLNSDIIQYNSDGRENSVKMLDSRVESPLIDVVRGAADGSSRKGSFCYQPATTKADLGAIEKDTKVPDAKLQS